MKLAVIITVIVFCLLHAGGVKISFSPFGIYIEKPFALAGIFFFILAIVCIKYDAHESEKKEFQKELRKVLEELKETNR